MMDGEERGTLVNVPLLIGLGLGVGALLGVALAFRMAHQSRAELSDSVEELKARTQNVLNELSQSVAELLDQARTAAPEAAGAPEERVR